MAEDNNDIARYIFLDILNEVDDSMLFEKCCIYKVPEEFRKENNDAYTPHLISIGPIHHGNAKLKTMEKHKCLYFRYFRQQLLAEGLQGLEDYTNNLGDNEEDIRSHYSEKYTNFTKKKFVRMILLDAVFIMELFLRKWNGQKVIRDDYLFAKSMINKSIERDLLLLENQIPFSILQKLYQLVPVRRRQNCSSFLQLARHYFQTYDPYPKLPANTINQRKMLKQGWTNPKHFTDLIRYFFVPLDLVRDGKSAPIVKTATKLKMAGITFEPVSKRSLLDVNFKKVPVLYWLSCLGFGPKWFKARLQIPTLNVDSSTESVLRNLMVYEQFHYPSHHYVCNYVALIDDLIHTEQDVDVLVESKVIIHELGSDKDLAGLINILCKNIVANSASYTTLSKKLNEHYDSFFNNLLVRLRLVYFPDLVRRMITIGIIIFCISWTTTIDDILIKFIAQKMRSLNF